MAESGSSKKTFKPDHLFDGGKFALGVMVGFTASVLIFLLIDIADIGLFSDNTLFGAVLGGVLAGSTALASTVLSNYYILKHQFEETEKADEIKSLSILTKLHEARDSIVKSYRHHFDGSPSNIIRYGSSGVIHKPLAFSRIDIAFSESEKAFLLGRKNAHLFNLILDADRLISSFDNISDAYERQFNAFQDHLFRQNDLGIRGSEISGAVEIDRFELLKMEDIRNVFKSFLLRSHGSIAMIHDETISFIRSEKAYPSEAGSSTC